MPRGLRTTGRRRHQSPHPALPRRRPAVDPHRQTRHRNRRVRPDPPSTTEVIDRPPFFFRPPDPRRRRTRCDRRIATSGGSQSPRGRVRVSSRLFGAPGQPFGPATRTEPVPSAGRPVYFELDLSKPVGRNGFRRWRTFAALSARWRSRATNPPKPTASAKLTPVDSFSDCSLARIFRGLLLVRVCR